MRIFDIVRFDAEDVIATSTPYAGLALISRYTNYIKPFNESQPDGGLLFGNTAGEDADSVLNKFFVYMPDASLNGNYLIAAKSYEVGKDSGCGTIDSTISKAAAYAGGEGKYLLFYNSNSGGIGNDYDTVKKWLSDNKFIQ